MVNSFHLRNFRGFKDIEQGGLKRFNFIVGDNGSGKTALLEALFLIGGGSPEIYFRIRRWRGFGESGIELSGTKDSYESLFRDLFHDFDQQSGIHLSITDSGAGERSLRIYYEHSETYSLPLKGQPGNAYSVDPIVFRWKSGTRSHESKVTISDGGLKMSGGGEVYPFVFISPQTQSSKANAQRFSDLSKQMKAGPIVEAVKETYPQVRDVTLEALAGELMLHVQLEGLTEKLPIAVLSGGINKYLAIVLAIVSSPDGAVLVDEIENGFYYSHLPKLLGSIVRLCEVFRVQLIASTHSYEFLQALAPVMAEEDGREEHFSFLRLEQSEKGSTLRLIRGNAYKSAIEQGFEVR